MADTHEIVIIKPKPASEEILRLTAAYFDARGVDYDAFEEATPKRDLYIESVNKIVGGVFENKSDLRHILSVACGTGRRELEIEKYSKKKLDFVGVELSAKMAELSRSRGLSVVQGSWPDVQLPNMNYDAGLVLSAFGHVPDQKMRVKFLSKLADSLKPGAPLFFDVLNLDDKKEWGPRIAALYETNSMGESDYSIGDVIYRKIGEPELCFYHYFSADELKSLLLQTGFELSNIWRIGYGDCFGELMTSEDGAFLVQARKAG
jgi:SAM-dependent methyltransferase